jgi:hypothetical protein
MLGDFQGHVALTLDREWMKLPPSAPSFPKLLGIDPDILEGITGEHPG